MYIVSCDGVSHVIPLPLLSINLKVKSKELVAVVGHVGAGKSSLVQALLGEMEKVSGTVTIKVLKQTFSKTV